MSTTRGRFLPVKPRILARTEKSTGCWLWQGAMDKGAGYGRITAHGISTVTHRASYEAFVGPIPAGHQIDHLCRVRACCNPDHLEAVIPRENLARSTSQWALNERNQTCVYGHEFARTHIVRTSGDRRCQLCALVYARAFRAMTEQERDARRKAGLPVVDMAAALAAHEEVAA